MRSQCYLRTHPLSELSSILYIFTLFHQLLPCKVPQWSLPSFIYFQFHRCIYLCIFIHYFCSLSTMRRPVMVQTTSLWPWRAAPPPFSAVAALIGAPCCVDHATHSRHISSVPICGSDGRLLLPQGEPAADRCRLTPPACQTAAKNRGEGFLFLFFYHQFSKHQTSMMISIHIHSLQIAIQFRHSVGCGSKTSHNVLRTDRLTFLHG